MRARELIPAWGKAALFGAAIAGCAALLYMSPWNSVDREQKCVLLHEQIEAVAREGRVRSSDTLTLVSTRSRRVRPPETDAADFPLLWTLDDVRACLGAEWLETAAQAEAEVRGEAWVFVRAGGPMLSYIRARVDGYRSFSDRIVIEPITPS